MTDPFVIRKHASMLADAGIDVIIFDTDELAANTHVTLVFNWFDELEKTLPTSN